jgi:pyrroline-5-carboxylate reductase
MNSTSIGFIGAGNMANSLIRGLLDKGQAASSIWAADLDSAKLEALQTECGINIGLCKQLTAEVDVLVLAVKPQVMQGVCEELAAYLLDAPAKPRLIVSIAAGITLYHLQQWLGAETAIVRCMPNTPALVGRGASGLYANAQVSAAQKELANDIMQAVGIAEWLDDESAIDSVTALSGSGPAYFFLFMEAMQNTAMDMGLSAELARSLTYQTALGAAELALSSEDTTQELRRKVTSPGGTTEQALNQFESGGLRELVETALNAARQRSIELADEFGK